MTAESQLKPSAIQQHQQSNTLNERRLPSFTALCTFILALVAVQSLLSPLLVSGSETDSFTHRAKILDPSFPSLNEMLDNMTNARIQKAMDVTKSCNLKDLEASLLKYLGDVHVVGINMLMGALEIDLNNGESNGEFSPFSNGTAAKLPVVQTPAHEHIFSGFSLLREKGFINSNRLLTFVSFKFIDASGASLIIGSDKTSHFFSQGYEYYARVKNQMKRTATASLRPESIKRQAIRSALHYGYDTEVGTYGIGIGETITGTGIFSYADLATNAAGLHFWLTTDQYFDCADKRWSMRRPFRWTEYVSPAWDESINGNAFMTTQMEEKVLDRLGKLHADRKVPRPVWPLEPSYCGVPLLHRFADVYEAELVLHPDCFSTYQQLLTNNTTASSAMPFR